MPVFQLVSSASAYSKPVLIRSRFPQYLFPTNIPITLKALPFSHENIIYLWLTRGSYSRLKDQNIPKVEFIHPHGSFCIGDAKITPFPIPHDAAEPCQYIISDGIKRFAIATDMGCVTPYVHQQLNGVDALLLEANYDHTMLQNGSYPYSLRTRIDGRYGHLSNDQSAELAAKLEHPGLQKLFLGHLSENNNTPQSAFESVANRLQRGGDDVTVLKRAALGDWFALN